jgi:acetyltransferase-like isoleucine patch superfamily enzyme
MIRKCKIAKSVKIPFPELVNLYECEIKEDTFIGPFVEIQKGAKIGRRCRVQSHAFICEGVTIEDDVFIGHGVMFTNDLFPVANDPHWKLEKTVIEDKVSIGNNATLLPVRIGKGSLIGAGSVVTKDVPKNTIVAGNPARKIREYRERSRKSP